ncbi:hypothetical protein [Kitasatospora aureofaciens]|uniref:hypothetical protein n=1 Tax=Kitasatospora aureofaciens TaxID=1894 RepID=UPI00340D3935
MAAIKIKADELIPGDLFNTHCGIGLDAFRRIAGVRVIENDAPGAQDRIEIRWDGTSISPARVLVASSTQEIWVD